MAYARKKPRKDLNHTDVVEFFRKCGASVHDVSAVPNGFDILVGWKGFNIVVEIKSHDKKGYDKDLTDGEKKFKDSWRGGTYHIAYDFEDCLNILKHYDRPNNTTK